MAGCDGDALHLRLLRGCRRWRLLGALLFRGLAWMLGGQRALLRLHLAATLRLGLRDLPLGQALHVEHLVHDRGLDALQRLHEQVVALALVLLLGVTLPVATQADAI